MQYVIAGISDQWEFLLPLALSVSVVWDRLRWSKRQTLAACALMALAFTIAGVGCGLLVTGIQIPFMILMTCLIPLHWRMSGLPFTRALFISATSLIPMMLCVDLSVIFNALVVGEDGLPLMQWPGMMMQWALTLILFAICNRPMRRLLLQLVDCPAISERAWSLAWLVPFLSASLFTVLSPTATDIEAAPSTALTFVLLLLLFTVLLVLFYVLLGAVARQSDLNAAATEANRQLTMRQMQQEHLNERIAAAQRVRHDLRQHLLTIRGFVDAKDGDGLLHYLDTLEASATVDTSIRYCEHFGANIIAVYYADRARTLGAAVDIAMDIPAAIALPEADLAVTLGNLLENAVDALAGCSASGETAKLTLRASATDQGPLFLIVSNTFEGDVSDLDAPAVPSTKHDGMGLGIQSVRRLAQERGGEARFTADQNTHTFTAEVVLPPAL
ncbi:sensor histidine kinase [Bifidobacterium oedipodis]|uniref:Histidine kinase n=1 Tax=Bifidobacterium oedipodis TaxID=2675322 RepID=A0A7Y0EPP8_9BIFI|nr:GHKL domain-containing protein [Bifidobacterium sp. DSM 109957]NMM94057.1 histidine kinase [Bifidobacterium sp. DSM 109957]